MPSQPPRSQEEPRFKPQSSPLMNQVREILRYHHYAIRTEEVHIKWIPAFIRFNGRKHQAIWVKQKFRLFCRM